MIRHVKNIARVRNYRDITTLQSLFGLCLLHYILSFCLLVVLSFWRFVRLSFCLEITPIKCLRGLNSQKSHSPTRVGIELPGQLEMAKIYSASVLFYSVKAATRVGGSTQKALTHEIRYSSMNVIFIHYIFPKATCRTLEKRAKIGGIASMQF